MKLIIFSLIVVLYVSDIQAKPQYTVLTGNKCQNCHFTAQGGGLRSELGWYSNNESSLVSPDKIGLQDLFDAFSETNTIEDGLVTYGMDFRYQTAKLGGPKGSHREYFMMQLSPYIGFSPLSWLDFTGHYNFVEALYQGQQNWSAAVIIKPSYSLPSLKVGFIQPSIGVRYDDHTMFARQAIGFSHSRPIVPPDYAEFGSEINYEGLKWLSLTAGVFSSQNMSEVTLNGADGIQVPLVDKNKLSTLFRAAVLPRFFGHQINTNIGLSYFANSDFKLLNYFFHIGLSDQIAFLAEYAVSDKENLRMTNNLSAELSYIVLEGLTVSVRYETGNTEETSDPARPIEYKAEQYVIGMNVYPLPFIEIRPEYRIYDRANFESYSSQWAVQLHVFY